MVHALSQPPLPKLEKMRKRMRWPSRSSNKELAQTSISSLSEKETSKGHGILFAIYTHKLDKELSTPF